MKRDKKLLKAVIITGIEVIIGICVMIAVSRLSKPHGRVERGRPDAELFPSR